MLHPRGIGAIARSRLIAAWAPLLHVLGFVSLSAILTGCGLFGGDDRPAYERAGETEPLEVPPDLSPPAADSRMTIPPVDGERVSAVETARLARQAATPGNWTESASEPVEPVLPRFADMRLRRQGGVRWLEVDADPAALWPKLRDFWRQAKIDVARAEPALGIMQTGWVEPPQGAVPGNAFRDSYRLRLERRDSDTTNIYITHRGFARTGADGDAEWAPRPSDLGLEAEYLTRLMVYLGEPRQQAERLLATADSHATAMRLDRVAGIPVLVVKDRFSNVWQLTGVALDRAGLPVEEEDVGNGTYYFRYTPAAADREGVLTGLPGEEHDDAQLNYNGRYQVHLLDQPGQTLITAQRGDREPLPPGAAEEILQRLIASMQGGLEPSAQLGTIPAPTPDGA